MNDVTVANLLGQSIGLGMVASAITQFIKITEDIPFLAKFAPIKWVLDKVASGNDASIHLCVAIVATFLNGVSLYMETGNILTVSMAISTFGSFVTALGTHNALSSYKPKN